jgi:hypothetical protein
MSVAWSRVSLEPQKTFRRVLCASILRILGLFAPGITKHDRDGVLGRRRVGDVFALEQALCREQLAGQIIALPHMPQPEAG